MCRMISLLQDGLNLPQRELTQVALFLGAKIREASSCRPREQDGCTWQSACQFFGLVASGQDLQCWFPCSLVVSD